MPRSFDTSADYDGSVEVLHRAFSDADYWRARLTDSGGDETRLESMRVGGEPGHDNTIEVAMLQVVHSKNLPALVTQLHRGDLHIRRTESWGPIIDGTATASLGVSITDAPVNLSGTAVLSPTADGGSRIRVMVTVQVRVPIVGGKVEKILVAHLTGVVEAEQRFTAAWIKDHA
jgi:Protein of unknown function (DUF2505)